MSQDKNIIKASPTKNFFITMLIRDLTLRDAIGDLVDNSVDGARKLRENKKYAGLEINIEATPERFSIIDNCGGFSVETAREYAFRFGRPDDAPPTHGSIGQFGIGMKRALFKLGNDFKVSSVEFNSRFLMEVNVPQWAGQHSEDLSNWNFSFSEHAENLQEIPERDRGTSIIVENLHQDVRDQFATDNFIKRLITEIELENLYNIDHGLTIRINGSKLKARHLNLINNEQIRSAIWHKEYTGGMNVRIYAGVSDPVLEDGGWYIFCNDRLVLGPEQTEITGWTGGRNVDGVAKYHGQFRRFRGYVFFDSQNPSLLPWNTAKNGMDLDSPSYRSVKHQMIQMMRPVISFLNKLKEENENDNPLEDRKLNNLVESSSPLPLSEVQKVVNNTETFIFPIYPSIKRQEKNENKIVYYRPKEQVEKVRKTLGVNTLKEVGEATFDYYYSMEVE
ncbi:ATP-binding protein [Pedobacter sp. GR22-6]|uniref:ATP-binding protein n=1 Tax=Pedobacter sp. GR22-6 TaxID=3127957 RepID=UPI00307ECDE3